MSLSVLRLDVLAVKSTEAFAKSAPGADIFASKILKDPSTSETSDSKS
jgi:hypothetical protein